jgi:CDP-diglyceride synthetase
MVSFLLFYGSSIMWEGGFAVGPRYLLPMVPFMLPGMAIAWATAKQSLWGRMLLGVLSAWSVGVVWLETISGQSFPDWTANPLFNYSLPKFFSQSGYDGRDPWPHEFTTPIGCAYRIKFAEFLCVW